MASSSANNPFACETHSIASAKVAVLASKVLCHGKPSSPPLLRGKYSKTYSGDNHHYATSS